MDMRKRLRDLLAAPRLAVLPGAYDALSARIIERTGFDAILAGGYAATGSLLAQPDMGQSNMRDYADHYARICAAVDIPVFVDADTGFGGVQNVRQMVRAFEAAGVAGLFITDQTFPNRCNYLPGKQVVAVAEMLAKLAAALDARRDGRLVICGRTDVASTMASMPPSSAARCSCRRAPTWRCRRGCMRSPTWRASSARCPVRIWRRCRTPPAAFIPAMPSSNRRVSPRHAIPRSGCSRPRRR